MRYISTGITGDNSGNIVNYMDEAQRYTTSTNSKDNPDSTRGGNLGDETVSSLLQWLVAASSNQDSTDNSVDSRGIQHQSKNANIKGGPYHGIQKRSPIDKLGFLTDMLILKKLILHMIV